MARASPSAIRSDTTAHAPPTPPADPGALCFSCGLCCDGTVFSTVTFKDDERHEVERLGLTVFAEDGRLHMAEPCPAFQDGCCALYTTGRPNTCVNYQCRLLSDHRRGLATHDDCVAVILTVRSLAADLERAMGLPAGGFTRAAAQEYIRVHAPQDDAERHADFVAPFARLALLGVEYFAYPVDPGEQAVVDGCAT